MSLLFKTLEDEYSNTPISSDIALTYHFLAEVAEEEHDEESNHYKELEMETENNTDYDSFWVNLN